MRTWLHERARPRTPLSVAGRALILLLPLALLAAPSAAAGEPNLSYLRRKLLSEAKGGDPDEVRYYVNKITDQDDALVTDALLYLGTERHGFYGLALQRLVDSLRSKGARRLQDRALRSKRWKERLLAVEASWRRGGAFADKTIPLVLREEDDLRILRVAVAAARERRMGKAIPHLIDLIDDLGEDGGSLVAHEAGEALREISGRQLFRVDRWRTFWEEEGEGFVVPSEVEREPAPRGPRTQLRVKPTFFSVQLLSKRAVFVIDVSGSMSGSSLRRVKRQLSTLLGEVSSDTRFLLLAYTGARGDPPPTKPGARARPLPEELGGYRWLERSAKFLRRASRGTIKKARAWIEALEARGSTYTAEALFHAIETRGVEQVILLSDGSPTDRDRATGRSLSSKESARRIAEWNRFHRVRIDTIGLRGGGARFLQQVARESGGTYTSID